ncbi:MAG: serine/threonine-protein kinase [Rhizonema sp. PD37]|nr:serine/threonine-protein kinase [Rhizonema sp. PD37]
MITQKVELDIYIGKFLNNRYLIRDLIGKGSISRVYLAEDAAKGGMPIAMKILSLNLLDQSICQRFVKEIFIGAQLGWKNKHIVRVLSYGVTDEKNPYYVMEYLHGKSLKEIIKNQPLEISNFLDLCKQICLGLHCAHQGISIKGENSPVVHRDIKPDNIFITEDNKNREIVKILDFGIAKFLTELSGMSLMNSFVSSLPYYSPEHLEGRKLLDMRSDIYSFGVLMFEMLTGKHPFQTQSNSFSHWYQAHRFETPSLFEEIIPHVQIPQEIKKIVMSCLAKDVDARPQNLNQILAVLENVQQKLDSTATDISNFQDSSKLQLVPFTSLSEKACLQQIWPQNKPIAPICFPNLLYTPQGTIPTFWAMLPQKEIAKFLGKTDTTEFIYAEDIYPMLLWITVLCDEKLDMTRWLSYFLDIKEERGQNIVKYLADIGYYHLLLFALEEPTHCTRVMTLTLSAEQRSSLANWLKLSQEPHSNISFEESKKILKAQYEKLKPEILHKLTTNQTSQKPSIKTWLAKLFFKLIDKPKRV